MLRQKIFQVITYIHHWLSKVDAHSLQSPYLFALYNAGKLPNKNKDWVATIEEIRKEMLNSDQELTIEDFGAGSSILKSPQRRLKDIARYSISSQKEANLLSNIVGFHNPKNIIELGTGLGITTLYLANTCPEAEVTTFEGAKELATIAKKNIKRSSKEKTIKLIQGNINDTLPLFIAKTSPLDFVFIDANHTREATLSYFYAVLKKCHTETMIIIDDIHWSEGMQLAWQEIVNQPDSTITIDYYQFGVILLNPKFKKQTWVF